jgi:transposase
VGANFIGGDPDQLFLMAPDVRDWLPRTHLAWRVRRVVDGFDLSGFLAGYRLDGQGAAAYHRQSMLGLVCYCYCTGVRSSRAIEAASYDDVGARVILGNHHPDHATIARFVARHAEAIKKLLVQTLVVCAREGLVGVELIAGDGTKVKANASMRANATLDELDIDIDRLEGLLAEQVDGWLEEAGRLDAEDAARLARATDTDPPHRDDRDHDDEHDDDEDDEDDGGHDDVVVVEDARGGGDSGPARCAPRRAAQRLLRLRVARQRLLAAAAADTERVATKHRARIENWERRVAAQERTVQRERDKQRARVDGWEQRAAAKAAAGRGQGPDGRRPCPVEDHTEVRRANKALATARQRLDRHLADPAGSADPAGATRTVNTTDPSSRIMPGKQGAGFAQRHNVQVTANQDQIILAITDHDSPNDVAALAPLPELTRANLDAAAITDPIGAAAFDAGYASDANFTRPAPVGTLYIAVCNQARHTAEDTADKPSPPATKLESRQQMADRLQTPEGKAIYGKRAGIIEPVFAQLFQRLGRNLNYRHHGAERHLWAVTHNLLKAFKHQTLNPQAAT